jgi:hypothetical protein
MVRFRIFAGAAIVAVGAAAAACIGFGLARLAPVDQAQFEIQVEEGLGPFHRLPIQWAALHLR